MKHEWKEDTDIGIISFTNTIIWLNTDCGFYEIQQQTHTSFKLRFYPGGILHTLFYGDDSDEVEVFEGRSVEELKNFAEEHYVMHKLSQ